MSLPRKSCLAPMLIVIAALMPAMAERASAQDAIGGTRIAFPANPEGLFKRSRSTEGDDGRTDAPAGAAQAPMTTDQLIADDSAGLPVPKQSKIAGHEKTIFRVTVKAEVHAPLAAVLGFYSRELGKRADWHQQSEASDTAGPARVEYATPEGPAVLTLTETSGTTSVTLLLRKQKEAQASGLMPKPGQARLLVPYKDAVLSAAANAVKLAVLDAADVPDWPTLEVKPGTYAVRAEVPGLNAPPASIDVGADEIWGLVISPGGVIPVQMY